MIYQKTQGNASKNVNAIMYKYNVIMYKVK